MSNKETIWDRDTGVLLISQDPFDRLIGKIKVEEEDWESALYINQGNQLQSKIINRVNPRIQAYLNLDVLAPWSQRIAHEIKREVEYFFPTLDTTLDVSIEQDQDQYLGLHINVLIKSKDPRVKHETINYNSNVDERGDRQGE